ncbi:M20 aminoacylase family protein [Paracoccus saliphilus]|uniref:Amidohydrolase n=1 Tax=Paracoccus saliphilus TaxID=405559 RepID=A0AA45W808_9RHOB|nr:M20 aminoacylase family protein [Paracoccus saliphilus]WCR04528.1 amidohydrolase [Paracoccus saliphilus]SIT13604.1 hippurate hydrolase [Paracoccus saliphilus]
MNSQPLHNDLAELVAIRRDLHAHPELGLEEVRTSDLVAGQLSEMGYKVERGLARTGLVATLSHGSSRKSIGIRADMDALPIAEETGLPYASTTPGLMHACGHDGHTAVLLGAARAIAERRNFDGTVHLIFQPAEENFGGAKLMMDEGLFDRFPCDAVFALHNDPMRPFGQFAFRDGPIMAAIDEVTIKLRGYGGHGSEPEHAADPIVAGSSIVMALQTVVSRNIAALDAAVVSVGAFHGGTVSNIIPSDAEMIVGVRTFDPLVRDEIEARIKRIAAHQAESYGLTADVDYQRSYDSTVNHKAETDLAREVAIRVAGAEQVLDMERPMMGSEDFGYMLAERPGSYFFLGGARGSDDYPLHHARYNFNDDLLPIGTAFWTDLVETYLRPL